jgi:protein TonB
VISGHTKIGLATSTFVHLSALAVGLTVAAPYLRPQDDHVPHLHLHRGAIEIQGSFAPSFASDTTAAFELPAEKQDAPRDFTPPVTETDPTAATPVAKSAQQMLLESEVKKPKLELALCDCPAKEHVLHTPKRPSETSAPAPAPAETLAPVVPRATNVSQVTAATTASVPALSEPAGSPFDVPPKFVTNRPPPYPAEAYRLGQEGKILLEVRITLAGTVESLRVVESSGFPLLDQAALETVRGWTFEPAKKAGRSVEATVKVPVRFNIRNS